MCTISDSTRNHHRGILSDTQDRPSCFYVGHLTVKLTNGGIDFCTAPLHCDRFLLFWPRLGACFIIKVEVMSDSLMNIEFGLQLVHWTHGYRGDIAYESAGADPMTSPIDSPRLLQPAIKETYEPSSTPNLKAWHDVRLAARDAFTRGGSCNALRVESQQSYLQALADDTSELYHNRAPEDLRCIAHAIAEISVTMVMDVHHQALRAAVPTHLRQAISGYDLADIMTALSQVPYEIMHTVAAAAGSLVVKQDCAQFVATSHVDLIEALSLVQQEQIPPISKSLARLVEGASNPTFTVWAVPAFAAAPQKYPLATEVAVNMVSADVSRDWPIHVAVMALSHAQATLAKLTKDKTPVTFVRLHDYALEMKRRVAISSVTPWLGQMHLPHVLDHVDASLRKLTTPLPESLPLVLVAAGAGEDAVSTNIVVHEDDDVIDIAASNNHAGSIIVSRETVIVIGGERTLPDVSLKLG